MRRPPRRPFKNHDVFPDVRDGLTRPERVVLTVLAQAQAARGGRNVPVAELYGRVVEVLDLSQDEVVDILRRLGAGTPAGWRGRAGREGGFTLLEIMIVVAIIAILAAIAVPNFQRSQGRARQGEAKANLKSLFVSHRSYFSENGVYPATSGDWGLEGGNRYRYQLADPCLSVWQRPGPPPKGGFDCLTRDTSRFQPDGSGPVAVSVAVSNATFSGFSGPGVVGTCPNCGFLASAQANLDGDAWLDSWFITSHDGVVGASFGCEAVTAVTAGVPSVYVDDVACD